MQRVWSSSIRGLVVVAVALAVGSVHADEPAVDGARVYHDLADLVAIGPRPATSPGAARARDLVAERLRQAGFKVKRTKFTASAAGGPEFALENVVGRKRGTSDAVVVLVTHLDGLAKTRSEGSGATCDAAGVAVLLEVARQLGAEPLRASVQLVFADGHWPLSDSPALFVGLYGSKDQARSMVRDGSLGRVRAVFVVDHVGGRELRFANEAMMTPDMRRLLFDELHALGHEDRIDLALQVRARDDHEPFVEQGVRSVLALIGWSSETGRSLDERCRTGRDELDGVDKENLMTAARLAVRLAHRIDAGK